MRKQEFRFQTHLPSPARRGSRSRTASPPAPLAIRKTPSARVWKSRRQSLKSSKHLLRQEPQLAVTTISDTFPRPLAPQLLHQHTLPLPVHRFAARAPCDSKGSECQCGIHTAEAASALRSRKTERAASPFRQYL